MVLVAFPAVKTCCDRARIQIELDADRATLRAIPLPVLASALLKMAQVTRSPLPLAAAGLTASEARIDALLGKSVVVPFERHDLLTTGLVLLLIAGTINHLAALSLCHVCSLF